MLIHGKNPKGFKHQVVKTLKSHNCRMCCASQRKKEAKTKAVALTNSSQTIMENRSILCALGKVFQNNLRARKRS